MKLLNELDLSNKKYIIFDLDGTLIDSIGIWNIADYEAIKRVGNQEIDLNILQQQREEFSKKNTNTDIYLEYCNYLIKKYKLNISKEELLEMRWSIAHNILENEMDFKEKSIEVLKKLKELGFTLILATMSTKNQIDIYSSKNKIMKNKLNISTFFDLIVKKEDVKNKKPHPEIYLYILNYYQTTPKQCLVFEDSLHGIIAAKKANLETINIYDKYSNKDRDKINKLTDFYIVNYQEILDKLNN